MKRAAQCDWVVCQKKGTLTPFSVLNVRCAAKQRLMGFLLMNTVKATWVQKMLPRFLALIEQFATSPAKVLSKSRLEPVWI